MPTNYPTSLDDDSSLPVPENLFIAYLGESITASTPATGGSVLLTNVTGTAPSTGGYVLFGSGEIVKFGGASASALTSCSRAQGGTTAAAAALGATVHMPAVKEIYDNLRDAVVALEGKVGTGASGHVKDTYLSTVGSTAVEIIPDGTDDVTARLDMLVTVKTSSGSTDGGITYCENSGSTLLYDDGTNKLKLAVAADGSVTLQRSAGTVTFDVALRAVWL